MEVLADAYIEQLDAKPSWLDETINQIRALSTLEANWDSYGAEPVSPGAINRAVALLTTMAKDVELKKPDISATPDGQVTLMWDTLDIAVGEQHKEHQIEP